ncbi:alpha/beta hydrolase [Flavihumibacter fluvii]|nr:alpha/beta hydrolase [Flavihumibacter fluvii]
MNQKDWDAPYCNDWVTTIEAAIDGYDPSDIVLIAHSLGCSTVAQWTWKNQKAVKGALLVAPSDLEAPVYTFPAQGFFPIPQDKLPFRSIMVASDDDPWVSLDRAQFFANNCGSEYINIGAAGHINAAAGFGPWPQGLDILKTLG